MFRFIPNALSLLRMLLAIPVALLLAHNRYTETFGVLGIAALTDGLDGFIAKRFHLTSELGKILDPLADKILLVTAFITLSFTGLVPVWIAAIAVLRDVVITLGAIAYRVIYGPINGQPTILSKFNTLCQIIYLLSVIAAADGMALSAGVLHGLALIVIVTTLASGSQYVSHYFKRAFGKSRTQRTSTL